MSDLEYRFKVARSTVSLIPLELTPLKRALESLAREICGRALQMNCTHIWIRAPTSIAEGGISSLMVPRSVRRNIAKFCCCSTPVC